MFCTVFSGAGILRRFTSFIRTYRRVHCATFSTLLADTPGYTGFARFFNAAAGIACAVQIAFFSGLDGNSGHTFKPVIFSFTGGAIRLFAPFSEFFWNIDKFGLTDTIAITG